MKKNWRFDFIKAGSAGLVALLIVGVLLGGSARAETETQSPTIAWTRGALLDLREAVTGEAELGPLLELSCPLCSLLRGDEWTRQRSLRPDLAIVERALRKPHSEWHGLVNIVARLGKSGNPAAQGSDLSEQLDICWLELGILLDAADAASLIAPANLH